MVISGGTLVSDCHGAIIYLEGEEHRCMRCQQPCKSAGTLSEQYERDNAIPKEHARLKDAVVEAAKAYGRAARAVEDHMKKSNESGDDPAVGWQLLRDMESKAEVLMLESVWPLIAFEAEHKIGEWMMRLLAEFLMIAAFRVASSDSLRCDNLRWTVWQYFTRFRDAPRTQWQDKLHRIPLHVLWKAAK
jgi:hypothetical protein